MIRKLLATTAIATIAAGGAFAAEHSGNMDAQTKMEAEMKMEGQAKMQGQASERFLTTASEASLASEIIGEFVYTSAAENAESVGEVNDLVVGHDGQIDAAIIGVGGFLGIGEKDVAVSFDNLQLTTSQNGEFFIVLETSKEELESAPDFDAQAIMRPAPEQADASTRQPATEQRVAATETRPANDPMTVESRSTREMQATSQRERFKPMPADKMGTDEVIGATVYSYDDENVGDIGEVVLTDDGKIDAVIIDVGGFLGIGEKPVAVAFADLEFLTDENGTLYVYTRFSEEQLEAAAEYDEDEFKKNRDRVLVRSAG